MTIYILDNDPMECAKALDDRSLDFMIKDIAQVLCNVHHIIDMENAIPNFFFLERSQIENGNKIYEEECKVPLFANNVKLSDWNNWARECKANYLYLVDLGIDCCREYHYRNGKKCDMKKVDDGDDHCGAWHKMRDVIDWARYHVPDLPENKDFTYNNFFSVTEFPLVMPKKYIIDEDELNGTNIQAISSYQNYYQGKLNALILKHLSYDFLSWTNRKKPDWLYL